MAAIIEENREALVLAINAGAGHDGAVGAAREFLAFLTGGSTQVGMGTAAGLTEVPAEPEPQAVASVEGGDVAAPTAEPARAPKVTIDAVREALKAVAQSQGKGAAMELLAKHGADSVSKLAEDHYAAVLAEAEAAVDPLA